jgi:hypothetical protein
MFKIAKYLIYLLIGLAIYGLIWFVPKYNYVKKNPGYCANLTKNLYYCGDESDLKQVFEATLESKNQNK